MLTIGSVGVGACLTIFVGTMVHLMPGRIDSAQGKSVLFPEIDCILGAQIQFPCLDIHLIINNSGKFRIVVGETEGARTGYETPEERDIGTQRESFEKLETRTQIGLMQAPVARILHGTGGLLGFSILIILADIVTHVGIGQKTKTDTRPRSHAELHRDVIEAGVLGVQLLRPVAEIRILQRNASVENESQRIHGGVRSGIGRIDVQRVTQGVCRAAHCAAVGRADFRQLAIAVAGVGRIRIVLCDSHPDPSCGQERCNERASEVYHRCMQNCFFFSSSHENCLQR